ncbi:uncharacterized protein AtWU_01814 [Aspergillus tubingensis]|uniref:uncharacterized protein n=1 Tax=Aspergillus tubingensis TaxID=5068 RepID=UPI001579ED0F|nr:uncharacterized protein AtWU_01814 [Aspergillus tubingensis]GFN12017.1 unnamed protein product [Aspergillus tubingensis]
MGRAWDTHCTATNTHPNSTGLGWVDGTGLGHLDTRLDTVDQTPTRDWPRLEHPHATGLGWVDGMGQGSDTQLYTVDLTPTRDRPRLGGWDGPGTTTRHTQHSATTLLAHGRVEGTGLGQQSTTRQHNTDSYGSGLMVGWMGRAWKTLLYTLTPIYDKRDNFSGPMVGWMGRAWDNNSPHTTQRDNTSGLMDGLERTKARLVGRDGLGHFGDPALGLQRIKPCTKSSSEPGPALVSWLAQAGSPDSTSNTQVHTVNQASVGRSGRAWDIGFQHHHTQVRSSEPGLGWAVGKGLGHRIQHPSHWFAAADQASVGWLGRAWDIGHEGWRVWIKFYRSNNPSLGWVVGSGLGYRIQHPSNSSLQWWTRPRLGGWDGPGTSDTGVGVGGMDGLGLSDSTSIIQVHCSGEPGLGFTAVVNQALCWGKAALSTDCRELPDKTPCPGWVDGKGLGYRLTTTAQLTTAVDQASDGWTGRAWDILTSTVHHCSEPGLGWMDGTGLGHTNFSNIDPTSFILVHHCGELGPGWVAGTGLGHRTRGGGALGCHASKNQASDGRLGRAWASDSTSTIQFTTAVSQASVGRLGRAWDIGHGGGGVQVISDDRVKG